MQIPFLENALDLGFAAALDDHQHALLRFGEHDFVRRHARFALRNQRDVDLDARAAARAHFHVEQVNPAAPMSWMPTSASLFITSRQASRSSFSMKGSPTCTAGRFSADLLVELRRRHRRAMDAVAAGLGADVIDRIAGARGDAFDDVVVRGDAEAEHVDERIARVAFVERDFAADGRECQCCCRSPRSRRQRPRTCGGRADRRAARIEAS